ncbi:hypothetical protein Tco_0848331, partial [Tanacetum coccineum]
MILLMFLLRTHCCFQREGQSKETILFTSLLRNHYLADFPHLDDARDIWLAVKSQIYVVSEDIKWTLSIKPSGGHDYLSLVDLYNKLRTLEIDVKGGSNHYEEIFDQIGKVDLEELDIKCANAIMLSVRINRFEKKAGRKMKFNNKDAARVNKKKVKCYKCSELGMPTGDATGDVADDVSNAATEFALMGITSQ